MPDDTPQQQQAQTVDTLAPLNKAESLSADTSRWTAVKDWIKDFHTLPANEFDRKWREHPLTDYFISPKWQERLKGLIPLAPEAERLVIEAERRFPGFNEAAQEELRGAIIGAVQPGMLGTPMVGLVKGPGGLKRIVKKPGKPEISFSEFGGRPVKSVPEIPRPPALEPPKPPAEHLRPADFSDIGGKAVRRAEPKPTPEATVVEGGRGALSSEELARHEVFIKYSRGGQPTYLGKQPDAPLKQGEAILAVNRSTGGVRVQNTSGLADSDAMAKFGGHARENFNPETTESPEPPIEMMRMKGTPGAPRDIPAWPIEDVRGKALLDTDGELVGHGSEHEEFFENELIEKGWDPENEDLSETASENLNDAVMKGVVRLGGIGSGGPVFVHIGKEPTAEQRAAIGRLVKEQGGVWDVELGADIGEERLSGEAKTAGDFWRQVDDAFAQKKAEATPKVKEPALDSPKYVAESQGLVYKGELTPGSGVHMFEHPDHPGMTAALDEAEMTPEATREKMAGKLREFGVEEKPSGGESPGLPSGATMGLKIQRKRPKK